MYWGRSNTPADRGHTEGNKHFVFLFSKLNFWETCHKKHYLILTLLFSLCPCPPIYAPFPPAWRKSTMHMADLKTNHSKIFKSWNDMKNFLVVPAVSHGAVHCSLCCSHFSSFPCTVPFLGVGCMGGGSKLSAKHSSADIVIKSTTARVSSLHSPLICQPCSDGRLRKYMQNRWIRPLHTLPPNFRLFHTLRDTPPVRAHRPPLEPPLDIHRNICVYTHTRTAPRLCFPIHPFHRWCKTNYTDWGTKLFKMPTAKHCSAFNRTSKEKHKTNLAWPAERGMRRVMEGERRCVCVCACVVRADEKSFARLFMSPSRPGYESEMMLQRAALQIMLAHLKRADLCSLSGSPSIFFLLPPSSSPP